jgi:hypothetical protein
MSDDPKKLEAFVDRLVRDQPLRRAPASLEARVLAQLALRQTPRPWWRKGFTHWPLAARAAFLIASYGFVRLALAGVMAMIAFVGSGQVAQTAISWLHLGAEALSATASMGSFLIHTIPPSWLYGAAAFGFVLYALLFVLGTVAYRTLYVER